MEDYGILSLTQLNLTIPTVKRCQSSVNVVTIFCQQYDKSPLPTSPKGEEPYPLIADLIRDLQKLRYKLKTPITHHHLFVML